MIRFGCICRVTPSDYEGYMSSDEMLFKAPLRKFLAAKGYVDILCQKHRSWFFTHDLSADNLCFSLAIIREYSDEHARTIRHILSRAWNKKFTRLELDYNHFTFNGVEIILERIARNTEQFSSLNEISIRGNNLSDMDIDIKMIKDIDITGLKNFDGYLDRIQKKVYSFFAGNDENSQDLRTLVNFARSLKALAKPDCSITLDLSENQLGNITAVLLIELAHYYSQQGATLNLIVDGNQALISPELLTMIRCPDLREHVMNREEKILNDEGTVSVNTQQLLFKN